MKRKALTGASAVLLGACMLVVGLINLKYASYGGDFLKMMASVYPGYHDSRTISEVLIGTIYGLVDGAILGLVFSSLYRWMGNRPAQPVSANPAGDVMDPLLRRAS
jgi:hypothetical protein